MATITKTPAGTFRAIIKRNGRVLTTKTFRRKGDARNWARRIEADTDAAAALACPAAALRFDQLAEEYIDQWTGKDKSQCNRVRWWSERIGRHRVTDITTRMLKDELDTYAKGRAASTVNSCKTAVSSVFSFAMDRHDLPSNPARPIRNRRENNKREVYLSSEQLKSLLQECDGNPRLSALVTLAATTGARRGELLGLRWSDVDMGRRVFHLRDTKNSESRVCPIPQPGIESLLRIRKPEGWVFASTRYPDVVSDPKKPWNAALARLGWKEWFRFHDLRHSAASFFINNGATLEEVGQILGHRSVQTTRRYAHLSIERKQSLLDRVLVDIVSS